MKKNLPIRLASLTTILILFSVFSSCALPVHSRTVANRFDSPEASGALAKGHVEAGMEGGEDYFITGDATAVPVNLSSPFFERSDWDAFVSAGMGITDHLDIDVKVHFNSDSIVQAKYQFLGDSRLDAKEGNFSLAGTVGLGGSSNSESSLGDDSTASDTMTSSDYEFAVIGGYRFNDHGLVYTSPYFIKRNFSGTITQSNNTNVGFAGNLDVWGECLGVQVEIARATLKFEYAAAFTSAMGMKTFGSFGGIAAGFFW